MSDIPFKSLLTVLCEELVEQSKDPALWGSDDFNRGRLSMLHQIMLALDSDAKAFDVDRSKIGLEKFDVNDWFRLGPEYSWEVRS